MFKHLKKDSILELSFDIEDLSAPQIRLLKTINSNLMELLTAENEDAFFEKSNEIMKIAANAIKLSKFSSELTKNNKIPYIQQAIEFSLDDLNEYINSHRIYNLDN